MRHNDQETAELSQDVTELSRELATRKRKLDALRSAAERFRDSEWRDARDFDAAIEASRV